MAWPLHSLALLLFISINIKLYPSSQIIECQTHLVLIDFLGLFLPFYLIIAFINIHCTPILALCLLFVAFPNTVQYASGHDFFHHHQRTRRCYKTKLHWNEFCFIDLATIDISNLNPVRNEKVNQHILWSGRCWKLNQ